MPIDSLGIENNRVEVLFNVEERGERVQHYFCGTIVREHERRRDGHIWYRVSFDDGTSNMDLLLLHIATPIETRNATEDAEDWKECSHSRYECDHAWCKMGNTD